MRGLLLALLLLGVPQAGAEGRHTETITITVRIGEDPREERKREMVTFCEEFLNGHLSTGD